MNIPFFSALTGKASELKGKAWLNVSRPLSLEDLKGKVVIIDFWTYGCINCIHVLPDLKKIEKQYAGRPVVVIGCHSAKFENEQETDNIKSAVLRYGITHPVVVDDEMAIWNNYGVNA
jgi:thiol-disulfide isomerase/thioredoxin